MPVFLTKMWSRLAVAVATVATVTALGWGWSVTTAGGPDDAEGAAKAAVAEGTIAPELVPIRSCGDGCTHQ